MMAEAIAAAMKNAPQFIDLPAKGEIEKLNIVLPEAVILQVTLTAAVLKGVRNL